MAGTDDSRCKRATGIVHPACKNRRSCLKTGRCSRGGREAANLSTGTDRLRKHGSVNPRLCENLLRPVTLSQIKGHRATGIRPRSTCLPRQFQTKEPCNRDPETSTSPCLRHVAFNPLHLRDACHRIRIDPCDLIDILPSEWFPRGGDGLCPRVKPTNRRMHGLRITVEQDIFPRACDGDAVASLPGELCCHICDAGGNTLPNLFR